MSKPWILGTAIILIFVFSIGLLLQVGLGHYLIGIIQNPPQKNDSQYTLKMFEVLPANGEIKGLALVVHGLNLHPERMDPLAQVLQKYGYEVYRIALNGHRGSFEEHRHVDRKLWHQDIEAAHQKLIERHKDLSQKKPIKKIYLGYSLGALLGIDYATEPTILKMSHPGELFDHYTLFAPAVAINVPKSLIRIVDVLWPSLIFPSGAPTYYQANSWGAMRPNVALVDMLEAVLNKDLQPVNVPTDVFIDPEDELVSYEGIKEFMSAKRLDQWHLHKVTTENTTYDRRIKHLIIDEPSLGAKEWSRVIDTLIKRTL